MKKIEINNYLWIALSAICATVYFYIVYRFSINIPMDDDFPALQNFLVRFVQAEDTGAKISLMFESGNMHRLLWMRLMVLLVYALCGTLNYSIYAFVTSLFLVGTGVLLCWVIRKSSMKGVLMLIAFLLLFNGQNLGNSLFVMSGIANIGSVFITLLSVYLLLLNRRWTFICGVLLSLITIYSNGNGMLIIPPILICFWIQKRVKELITFGCIAIPASILYFYGLESSRMSHDIWSNIPVMLMNVFVFVGNNLWIPSLKYISIAVGVACVAVYLWGIFNKTYKENLFIYACLTFLYLTAVAVSVGNAPVLGGEATTPWRYRIYGSLFLILTAFLLINHARSFRVKKIIFMFPVLALLFNMFSTVYCFRKAERRFEQKMVSSWRWHREGKGLGLRYPRVEKDLIHYLKEAGQLGLYEMPQYPLTAYKNALHDEIPVSGKDRTLLTDGVKYDLEEKTENGFLIIDGWAYLTDISTLMEQEEIYIYLVNEENRWLCRPNFERRFDIIDNTAKADCGFLAVIDKKELHPGTYRIEIGFRSRWKRGRPVYYVSTDKTVEI